jgi:hypothetical protein
MGLACDMSCSISVLDILCRFVGCVSSVIVSLRVDYSYLGICPEFACLKKGIHDAGGAH